MARFAIYPNNLLYWILDDVLTSFWGRNDIRHRFLKVFDSRPDYYPWLIV